MRVNVQNLVAVFFCLSVSAFAQSSPPRFEAGPVFTCFTGCADPGNLGFGGRAVVNVTRFLAAEFQLTRLEAFSSRTVYGSGHAKITFRLEDKLKLNVFGLAGPGYFTKDRSVGKPPGPVGRERVTSPAFNIGGGVEIVPFRLTAVRFDFSDFYSYSKCLDFSCDRTAGENNFDFKAALMFRFP